MNRFHFLRSLSRYDHFSVCCPYFTSFFVLNLLATISEPALAVRDALASLRPVSPRSLEIFRVAFLFVCQIIPAAFTARSGSRIPAALEVFPRRNSDIISSHPITVNMFFNLFFTSVFSVLPAVISAVRHPFFRAALPIITLRFFNCNNKLQLKRRKRDLNPRAGFPTYTLSRGASSAS